MNEIHRINPPTSVVLSERKYPVITNEPSWSQICTPPAGPCTLLENLVMQLNLTRALVPAVAGLRSDDYKLLLQSTAIGAPIGYWIGEALQRASISNPPILAKHEWLLTRC